MDKSVYLAKLKRNNLLATAGVIGLLLAFIFLPEFTDLSEMPAMPAMPEGVAKQAERFSLKLNSPSGVLPAAKTDHSEPINIPEPEAETAPAPQNEVFFEGEADNLAALNQLLESGYFEYVAYKGKSGRTNLSFNEWIQNGNSGINWEHLRQEDVQRDLQSVINQTNKLIKNPTITSNQNTRESLEAYRTAANMVLKGDRNTSVGETLRELERLDMGVTDSLLRAKLSRKVLRQWSKINIHKIVGSETADNYKLNSVPPFNVIIALEDVYIFRYGARDRSKGGNKHVWLEFSVAVTGNDVKSIMVYCDNKKIFGSRNFKPNRRYPGKWFTTYKFKQRRVYRDFTVIVTGTDGERYEKVYSFYKAGRQMQWSRRRKKDKYEALIPRKARRSPYNLWADQFFTKIEGRLLAEDGEPVNEANNSNDSVVSMF